MKKMNKKAEDAVIWTIMKILLAIAVIVIAVVIVLKIKTYILK
jgi:hypothetical protein